MLIFHCSVGGYIWVVNGKPFGTETLLWTITMENIVDEGAYSLTGLVPEASVQPIFGPLAVRCCMMLYGRAPPRVERARMTCAFCFFPGSFCGGPNVPQSVPRHGEDQRELPATCAAHHARQPNKGATIGSATCALLR